MPESQDHPLDPSEAGAIAEPLAERPHAAELAQMLAQLDGKLAAAGQRSEVMMGEMLDKLGEMTAEARSLRVSLETEDSLTFERVEAAIGMLARQRDNVRRAVRPDPDLGEPWDEASAEALTQAFEAQGAVTSDEISPRDAQPREFMTPERGRPPPERPQHGFEVNSNDRLREIADRLEAALKCVPQNADLDPVLRRLDDLDTRVAEVFERRDTSHAAVRSRLMDAQVEELAAAYHDMASQLERLGAIEAQLEVMQSPSNAPQALDEQTRGEIGEAASAARSIQSLTAVVEREFASQRHRQDATTATLETLQQAMVEVLDRIEGLESAAEAASAQSVAGLVASPIHAGGGDGDDDLFDIEQIYGPQLNTSFSEAEDSGRQSVAPESGPLPASRESHPNQRSREGLVASAKRAALLAAARPDDPRKAAGSAAVRPRYSGTQARSTLPFLILGLMVAGACWAAVHQVQRHGVSLSGIQWGALAGAATAAIERASDAISDIGAGRVVPAATGSIVTTPRFDAAALAASPSPVQAVARLPLSMPPAGLGSVSLRLAAQRGDPQAQFEVAARFAEGRGTDQNLIEAFRWYEFAAMSGHVAAQYRLATFYERGLGTRTDLALARSWYQAAAETGNVRAMHNLAILLSGSRGTDADYTSAARWFEMAAERGSADSQFNLAILYESGLGVLQSDAKAYLWFAIAARRGDSDAVRRRDRARGRLTLEALTETDEFVRNWSALDHASS